MAVKAAQNSCPWLFFSRCFEFACVQKKPLEHPSSAQIGDGAHREGNSKQTASPAADDSLKHAILRNPTLINRNLSLGQRQAGRSRPQPCSQKLYHPSTLHALDLKVVSMSRQSLSPSPCSALLPPFEIDRLFHAINFPSRKNPTVNSRTKIPPRPSECASAKGRWRERESRKRSLRSPAGPFRVTRSPFPADSTPLAKRVESPCVYKVNINQSRYHHHNRHHNTSRATYLPLPWPEASNCDSRPSCFPPSPHSNGPAKEKPCRCLLTE